jgi:hypothetical protein
MLCMKEQGRAAKSEEVNPKDPISQEKSDDSPNQEDSLCHRSQ